MKSKTLRYGMVLAASVALGIPMFSGAYAQDQPPAPAVAEEADQDRVIIRVGNETITAGEFEEILGDLPPQVQMMAMGPGRRMLAEELVRFKLLAVEAQQRGLDQTPDFERRMRMVRDQVLATALMEQMQDQIDEQTARQYYEEHKDEFEGVTARHILVRFEGSPVPANGEQERTEEQARARAEELRQQIEDGQDFAELARAHSDDPGSGGRGGDLGTFGRGQMVPQFEEAAFALEEGQVSQPVRSPFGYHIIQVQERITPDFEEVRQEIEQRLGPEKLEELITELRERHETEIDDEYFGPANAQPMMPWGLE